MSLEPCLFCSTTEKITYRDDEPIYLDIHEFNDGERWYVNCGGCGARGPEAMSRRLAALKWNRTLKSLKRGNSHDRS